VMQGMSLVCTWVYAVCSVSLAFVLLPTAGVGEW
jgi:hypothetical protein